MPTPLYELKNQLINTLTMYAKESNWIPLPDGGYRWAGRSGDPGERARTTLGTLLMKLTEAADAHS